MDIEEPDCRHLETSIVRVQYSRSGVEQIRELCDQCGRSIRAVKKADVAHCIDELPVTTGEDVSRLQAQFYEARFAVRQAKWQADREEWQERYNEYLMSPEWRALRAKVIDRDGGVCRGCLSAKADVVHHLTYAHVFDELAFELISLCHDCHVKAHAAVERLGLGL